MATMENLPPSWIKPLDKKRHGEEPAAATGGQDQM